MSDERKNFHGSGNDDFTCGNCGAEVLALVNGSFRNHCPVCLWSRHVDITPGDRAETCRGLMEPVSVKGSTGSGWTLLHRCVDCGHEQFNRTALDDPRQPDDFDVLLQISIDG
ncbi:MAG: RNHCP domain-containing protein [Planctomycetota bacterium]